MTKPSLRFLHTSAFAFCVATLQCASTSLAFQSADVFRRRSLSPLSKSSTKQSPSDDDDGGEWRAFRARLVKDGIPSAEDYGILTSDSSRPPSQIPSALPDSETTTSYAHVTTPLVEVGTVLLSLPTPDLCQALDQQYWHRCVVLVTEVTENRVSGETMDLPDDQLAQGDRKGRWSYRGLMLNRLTDMHYAGEDMGEQDFWQVFRGGDLAGLSADETEFKCLAMKSGVGRSIVGSLSEISLDDAMRLCKEDPANHKPEDFVLLAGFCAWRPGQLEREMGDGREEWVAVSTDADSVWLEAQRLLQRADEHDDDDGGVDLLKAGTDMWRNLLSSVDISEAEATERLSPGQLGIYDEMLGVWAGESMQLNRGDQTKKSDLTDCSDQLGPGALVRAASPPPADVLLYEAEFVRSTVLVIEETDDHTVGVILNHPMAAAVDVVEGEDPLPLRYGGPIDVPSWRDGSYSDPEADEGEYDEVYDGFLEYQSDDSLDDVMFETSVEEEEEDDDSNFLWIHRDPVVGRQPSGGMELGSSNLWMIREDDAIQMLQSGSLSMGDVMVFGGVCIWEKEPGLGECGGGLREQVDALVAMEVVRPWRSEKTHVFDKVWEALRRQIVLTADTLESNVEAAVDAWERCQPSMESSSKGRLADNVLKAWVARSLLSDPFFPIKIS